MRIGICVLQDRRWRQTESRWLRAEAYGFDHAWVYDHLGWRDLVDGPWFDGLLTLTAAAGVTSTIKLGVFVSSPNFRNPVSLAREVTSLDDISDGRLLLGIGAGGLGFDAEVFGGEPLSARARVDRFFEFTTLLDRLLREDRVTWRGDYYTAIDARSTPGCVQDPRVPFILAANGPRTIRFAAQTGDGWVTTGPAADDLAAWWRAVGASKRRFEEELAACGRQDAEVMRILSLDSSPVFSLSSVGAFTDAVERASALGFTDVVTHWPRASGSYAGDEAVLEAVAAEVLPAHRSAGRP